MNVEVWIQRRQARLKIARHTPERPAQRKSEGKCRVGKIKVKVPL